MLRNVIWTRFFTKPVCWQNSDVIFEKIISPSYDIFFGLHLERLYTFESWIQNNWVCINWTSVAPDIQVEWPKVNTDRLRDLTLKAAISMLFLILFSCLRCKKRYGCYLFNAIGITSFQPLELTLCTKHRLKVKSANYLQFTPFCIFHPKVPSKHKTKNIKTFYI